MCFHDDGGVPSWPEGFADQFEGGVIPDGNRLYEVETFEIPGKDHRHFTLLYTHLVTPAMLAEAREVAGALPEPIGIPEIDAEVERTRRALEYAEANGYVWDAVAFCPVAGANQIETGAEFDVTDAFDNFNDVTREEIERLEVANVPA